MMKLFKYLLLFGAGYGAWRLSDYYGKIDDIGFEFKGFKNLEGVNLEDIVGIFGGETSFGSGGGKLRPIFSITNPFDITVKLYLEKVEVFDENNKLIGTGVLEGDKTIEIEPGDTLIKNFVFDVNFKDIISRFIGKQNNINIKLKAAPAQAKWAMLTFNDKLNLREIAREKLGLQ